MGLHSARFLGARRRIRSGAGQPHPAQQENMEIEQYIVSTDQQLVERALDGDTVAFEHLFNRYRDSIYQLYVQRTSGRTDDASDLLQETFVKVYLNMQRYDSRYTFGQWVYTIARNTFIDYMRRSDLPDRRARLLVLGRSHARRADDHRPEPRPARIASRKNVAPLPETDRAALFQGILLRGDRCRTATADGHGQNADTPRARTTLPLYYGKRIALKPHPVRSQPFSYPLIPRSRTFWTGSLPTKRTILRIPQASESPTQDRHAA